MSPAFLIKLAGLLLVSWVTLSGSPLSTRLFGILGGLLVLMALLDAGQALQAKPEADGVVTEADMRKFTRRLLGFSGAPFYVALMAFAFIGMTSQETASSGFANDKAQQVQGHVASAAGTTCGSGRGGGCGSAGGCGSGSCGASSGGSCGCASKGKGTASTKSPAKTTAATPRQLPPRAMPAVAPTNLPGINGQPLPAGMVPRPGAVLPPGFYPTPAPQAPVAATTATNPAGTPVGGTEVTPATVGSSTAPVEAASNAEGSRAP